MESEQGKTLFMSLMAKMPDSLTPNNPMMKMMGGFTVLRLSGMIGTMGVNLTKKDLLDLNAKLNKIKKPNK